MRLVLSLVTALALALTGCGGGTDTTTDTTSTTDTAVPEDGTTAPDDDPTEVDDSDATDDTDDDADGSGDSNTAGSDGDTEAVVDAGAEQSTEAGDREGDCSAAGLAADGDLAMVGEHARATAALLLDAAVRCDEQLLFTAAEESDTSFAFGSATFDDVFGLPEDAAADPAPWEALARLLHSTTPVETDGVWTWPAAFSADAADDADDAWQELVDSGLYTQDQVDQLRAAPDGYLGWRVGIDADGTWLFFTAGD